MTEASQAVRGWWIVLAVVAIAGVALFMRVPHLDRRPMHTDESINTILFHDLLTSEYKYDPTDRHGPGLFYATLALYKLDGSPPFVKTTENFYRAVPLIFGIVLILLVIPLRSALGAAGTVTAALFLAGSPAFVYYGRYFIHEVPYVVTIALTTVFLWQLASRRPFFGLPYSHYLWAPMVGLGMALMFTMKETCIIAWAGMGFGVLAGWLSIGKQQDHPRISGKQLMIYGGASLLVFLIVWSALISNFYSHMQGIEDAVKSYWGYADRASGDQGHEWPWDQYITWMTTATFDYKPVTGWWGESAIIGMSLVGLVAAIIGRTGSASMPFARAVAVYTVFSTTVFFAIPYKTPWNMLPILWGMILLSGVGVAALMPLMARWWARALIGLAVLGLGVSVCYWTQWEIVVLIPTIMLALGMATWAIFQPRLLLMVLVMMLGVHLGLQGWYITGLSIRNYGKNPNEVHSGNPYVYGHTSTDIYNLVNIVERVVAFTDDPKKARIRNVSPPEYYWPLPWYLRGYELELREMDDPDYPLAGTTPPIVICEASQTPALQERLDTSLYVTAGQGGFGLRKNVFLRVFVRVDLWNAMNEAQHSGD